MPTTNIKIKGMTCNSCEVIITEELEEQEGITNVKVNHKTGEASFDSQEKVDLNQINSIIKEFGYSISK